MAVCNTCNPRGDDHGPNLMTSSGSYQGSSIQVTIPQTFLASICCSQSEILLRTAFKVLQLSWSSSNHKTQIIMGLKCRILAHDRALSCYDHHHWGHAIPGVVSAFCKLTDLVTRSFLGHSILVCASLKAWAAHGPLMGGCSSTPACLARLWKALAFCRLASALCWVFAKSAASHDTRRVYNL